MPLMPMSIVVADLPAALAAGRRVRDVAAAAGCGAQDQARIGAAVTELAANAVRHAGGGRVEVSLDRSAGPALAVEVRDDGPGIADPDRVLPREDTAAPVAGGLAAVRLIVDAFAFETGPGGTRVRIAIRVPPGADARARATAVGDDPVAAHARGQRDLLLALAASRAREEELARTSRELDDTNRGVVALHAELEQRAEELKRASELKTRFFSFMSHEFRTPVNSILALARMLTDGVDGQLAAEQAKQVGFITRSAQDLAALVNDLLDLAKVEAGRFEIVTRTFTVAELFGGLKGVLRPLIPAASPVALVFAGEDDVPPLVTDESKLVQILRNLVSNALKFTEAGEVRVQARAEGAMVVFDVCDTGIGMPPEHVDAIFREFGQLQSRLSGKVKGTGLGLPLSRKLAALLGGTLAVRSAPGAGSTFTLRVPARLGVVADAGSSDAVAAETPEPRVLLIDDDATWRYLQRGLLSEWMLQVFESENGAEGLELARAVRPQLVLLDLSMPVMDGFQTFAALRADAALSAVPVVVATSHVLDAGQLARLRGAVAVIDKVTRGRDVDVHRLHDLLGRIGIPTVPRQRA